MHCCSVTWGSISQSRFICQFCVLVFKASLLCHLGVHQPKYVHLPSFVNWYSRHLCSGTGGGPSAEVCSSAKFCVLVFKASLLWYWGGVHQPKKVCLPIMNTLLNLLLLHRGLFYERPIISIGSTDLKKNKR